ncbi:hydantoinase/oxoprolinase N-terminal domain-containing protein [Oceanicola sp. S124]|uniref:hydantoinase/oxoprolinase N-terminal domain-containing protein n=1 Tax=Oceanicola sp. S124 TaxID=1042378 RepID=UPI0002558CF2|nr:hydantoinase/oxoprolinase N-terminal domain-containing protein [Oceanicola sp. S124]
MSLRLALDLGARFADFVAWDDAGVRIAKQPNGPDLAAVLRAGLAGLGLSAGDLHSLRVVTTAPLNALLDRAPAPVALLTSRGFADTLRLGRQNRAALYDPVATSPAPSFLVAPGHIHEIGGRLAADGTEVAPLDLADLDRAIEALQRLDVRAVAVCLLFSHVDPRHEQAVAARLRAALPDVALSLSHQVDPAPREYDRTVSAVLDAWVAARAQSLLAELRAGLGPAFTGRILLGDGRGVLVPEETFARRRALLLTGGPAAAARAGAASGDAGAERLILDIGSQSADIAMVRGGEPVSVSHGRFAGVDLRATMVDMASLPLGGARRVRRDAAGELHFDADDAAAPSLDDALAVLGLLPDADGGAARRLACLGEDDGVMASQIVTAAARQAALALVGHATRRNLDPLRAELCVMGGTGPLLATAIADQIGLSAVIVPRAPGAAGAMGLAQAPQRQEALHRLDRALDSLDDAALAEALDRLEADVPGGGTPVFTLTLAARTQMHPIELVLEARPASVAAIREELRLAYDQLYGVTPPGAGHLFSLRLHRDRAGRLPPMKPLVAGTPGGDAPRLLPTEAGAIHLPEGWQAVAGAGAWTLTRIPR